MLPVRRFLTHGWSALLSFAAAATLYLYTLTPDVAVSDFAEFQYLPARLGLAHPSGFPLFVLLGWLWAQLPHDNLALHMNVLSALTSALAVGLFAGFARALSGRHAVGLLAGVLLMFSPTLWKYAVAAERYGLLLSLLIGALWAAWVAGRRGGAAPGRSLYLSALLLGLALATHPTAALFALFWFAYVLLTLPGLRRSLRPWLGVALALLPGLLFYLYVPLRWAYFGAWPEIAALGRSSAIYFGLTPAMYNPAGGTGLLLDYLAFGAGMVERGQTEVAARLSGLFTYWLEREFTWWLGAAALVGFVRLWTRQRALAALLLGYAATLLLVVGFTSEAKYDAYLLPAFAAVRLCAAFALDWLYPAAAVAPGRARRAAAWLAPPLVLAAFVLLLVSGYAAHDRSRFLDNRRDWEAALAAPLEPGAALLGDWGDLTPFWYMQQALGRAPNVPALFPPELDTVIRPWMDSGKPLYLAGPLRGYAPGLDDLYTLVPWGRLVRIAPAGSAVTCPAQAQPVQSPEGWPFRITSWQAGDLGAGLNTLLLSFCYTAVEAVDRNLYLAVELTSRAEGPPLDFHEPLIIGWYPDDVTPAGIDALAAVPLRLPLGTLPGDYDVRVEPLLLDPERGTWESAGAPFDLGAVTVPAPADYARRLLTDERAAPLPLRAGPLRLRAWKLSNEPVRPGDPVRLDLVWEVAEAVGELPRLETYFHGGGDAQDKVVQVDLLPQDAEPGLAPGTIFRTQHVLTAPRGAGDATYWLELRLLRGPGARHWWRPVGWLVIGDVRVQDRRHVYELPEDVEEVGVELGGAIRLAARAPLAASACSGAPLTTTLFWQAGTGLLNQSFSVFVHLLDETGALVAQHDGVPADGNLPTTLWLPDEVIADTRTIPLPDQLAPGRYTLIAGMYDPQTGVRLPAAGSALEGAALLGEVNVVACD